MIDFLKAFDHYLSRANILLMCLLLYLYIITMKCPDTNLDGLFCFPYQPNITGMEWWYKFPYLQTYTIVTREPDSSLNFTKITKMPFLYKQFIPVNFTTQSIVHITLMENVFCQRNMLIKNDTVIRLHSYETNNHIFPIQETCKVVDELVYCVHFWRQYGHNIHDFLVCYDVCSTRN
ncbi:hypothetical protein TVAG_554480 [Trichomonas vaginalis G3]|uniref:Uncharacterized protein n=1 Tax=Trichomonas vaginalis (strain ATCC PRA-98 / G3) TaxID=412133 RepID=A2GUJ6_TRIV3|nr:hypothetical protein TVAG_554480 [Trichomonas vaginalis G3]|eukprot:XP_001292101.1 hypothetical protein [Trichomonas vaginalis G3]